MQTRANYESSSQFLRSPMPGRDPTVECVSMDPSRPPFSGRRGRRATRYPYDGAGSVAGARAR
jgi:hypothetical protein